MLQDLMHASREKLAGHRVVLFGSRARGEAKLRSDFDVGVIGESPLPLDDFHALADQLDALPTLYRIDWVDLASTNAQFRQAALEDAEVLFEA